MSELKRVGSIVTRSLFFIPVITAFLFAGAAADEAAKNKLDTEHLIVEWSNGAVTEKALEMVQAEGEKYYAAIHKMLGYEPASKITIIMEGPAERPDGSWGYPHVDMWGRINLFRFGPSPEHYFSALAHEMVHVFRRNRQPHNDWFLEEGLAEFVALRVDPSLAGFPWYDTPIVVVAGQWIVSGEDIPLGILRERHRAVNLPCKAQSYSLRSSFFHYLGERYGDDVVLEMSTQKLAGALSDYEKFFGKTFAALEAEWRESIVAAYNSIDDIERLAKSYREDTPIQYNPVCKKGDQF